MHLAQHRSRSGWSDRQVVHARQRRWVLFVKEMMSDHFLLSESVWRLCTRELLPRRATPPPDLCET